MGRRLPLRRARRRRRPVLHRPDAQLGRQPRRRVRGLLRADDNNCKSSGSTGGTFPKAAAEYVQVYSAGPVSNTNPVTAAAPAPAPAPDRHRSRRPRPPRHPARGAAPPRPRRATGLLVSYHTDRSAPGAARTRPCARRAYIYYVADLAGLEGVFKPRRQAATARRPRAMYDMVGTVDTAPSRCRSQAQAGQALDQRVGRSRARPARSTREGGVRRPGVTAKPLTTRFLRVSAAIKRSSRPYGWTRRCCTGPSS